MKNLGILILAVGVGLCAAYGGRNSCDMYDHIKMSGTVKLLGEQTANAKKAYCDARKAAELPEGDCAAAEKAAGAKPDTFEAALAAGKAAHKALAATSEQLSGEVSTARAAWIDAAGKEVEPKARLAVATLPGPGDRFEGWLALAGFPFLLGLVLIAAGAMVSRKAIKAEMDGDAGSGADGKIDFAVLLAQLRDDTATLSADANAMGEPTAESWDEVKGRIEHLQLNCIAPLVEARHQLQNRIGLSGFAAVFSPLSAGERKMNRAWSALVDQHWPESVASLAAASEQLAVAADKLTEELARA